jgi:hypothetical protein
VLADEVLTEAKHYLKIRKCCQEQIRQMEKWLIELSREYNLRIDFDNNEVIEDM